MKHESTANENPCPYKVGDKLKALQDNIYGIKKGDILTVSSVWAKGTLVTFEGFHKGLFHSPLFYKKIN